MDRSSYLDWSVVSDEYVVEAVQALLTEDRMSDRWDGITPLERSIHRLVLRHFIKCGLPPKIAELMVSTGLSFEALELVMRSLLRRDLIILDGAEVCAAYPFSGSQTRHQVRLGDRHINAICAIDALGTAAMTGHDTDVLSACPICERQIEISVKRDGLNVRLVKPTAAVIWAAASDVNGCAADTQCPSMLAFCSDEHLEGWRDEQLSDTGFRLTPKQATQIGAAIFRPFFRSTDRPLELEPNL